MNTILELKEILRNIGRFSCPNDVNFHLHTKCSDGSLTPLQLINQAATNKLKHIAVTKMSCK